MRNWVTGKLREKDPSQLNKPTYQTELMGTHGIVVHRPQLSDAYVYIPDASDAQLFTTADFDRARTELPIVDFVVIIKRRVANDAYPRADEYGIAVGPFGALQSALQRISDVSTYRTNEQKYVQSRLDGNAQVVSWRRVGESAYEITRAVSRRSLTIVTNDHYELISDMVYTILAQHTELKVDAVVVTNPSTRAFAPTVLTAADDAGTQVMIFPRFLASLREPRGPKPDRLAPARRDARSRRRIPARRGLALRLGAADDDAV